MAHKKEILPNRFLIKLTEESEIGPFFKTYIMVDRITGVNYIVLKGTSGMHSGESLSITPLLKADGTPAISDVTKL